MLQPELVKLFINLQFEEAKELLLINFLLLRVVLFITVFVSTLLLEEKFFFEFLLEDMIFLIGAPFFGHLFNRMELGIVSSVKYRKLKKNKLYITYSSKYSCGFFKFWTFLVIELFMVDRKSVV